MEHKNRNLYVEALRLIAMLFVFACHLIIHLDWHLLEVPGRRFALANTVVQYGQVVCIFFIISGYFLAHKKFVLVRIVRVWLPMVVYSMLLLTLTLVLHALGCLPSLDACFTDAEQETTFLKECLPFFMNSYWFMSTYIVLLLVAPFLNVLINTCDRKMIKLLITGLMVASSLRLLTVSIVAFTSLAKAITCYLIGAYFHRYRDVYQMNRIRFFVVIIIISTSLMLGFNYMALGNSGIANALQWNDYSSYHEGVIPAFILIAASLFALTLKYSESRQTTRGAPEGQGWHLVAIFSSSTFGVYLLHENYLGWRVLWGEVNALVHPPAFTLGTVMLFVLLACGLYALLLVLAHGIDTVIVNPIVRRVSKCCIWHGEG